MLAKSPRTEVIAVGSELLGEGRAETNSMLLAHHLGKVGIEIRRKVVVGDDAEVLSEALRQSLKSASLILVTGGLGPTEDDITREVVSAELGRELHIDSASLERLKSIYRSLKLEVKPNSLRQVRVPQGAEVLQNDHGTAPGLTLSTDSARIFLLPGPARELGPMLESQVMPRIDKEFGTQKLISRSVRLASVAESAVDARVKPILSDYPGIQYTILSSLGLIETIFKSAKDDPQNRRQLEALHTRICKEFSDDVYSTESEEIPAVVGRLLQEKGLMLATAESCTGGAISRSLTHLAGSSSFFMGGVVAYSNQVKQELLGVQAETIRQHGAVSSETALAMAEGVCRAIGVQVGISVTGIAGPEGGSRDKPVGTLWFGLSLKGQTDCQHRYFPGKRAAVRTRATHFALDWLRRHLVA